MNQKKIHPAWIAAAVTWITLVASAGYRSAPSILIVPLEDAFGWTRNQISLAISVYIFLFGLTAPFAAALMERFTVRKVVISALAAVSLGALLTIFMNKPWHLVLL
ncbi:MAG: MFS transporter, partial [Candidatus Nanopelagicaceae bacterium]